MVRPFTIEVGFPGGNAQIDGIEGDTVHLRPDLRDTQGDWFYWCFGVRGAQGRTLRFRFPRAGLIGVHGPAVSRDGGRSWQWAGAPSVEAVEFTHTFGSGESDVRFSVGVPYLLADLQAWLDSRRDAPRLKRKTLCLSRGGAAVPLLRIQPAGQIRRRVLLTARHHCCEAMASYVLEGVLDAALDDASIVPDTEIVAVPMVDLDGVQAGDQGKNRRPHDHNRDYFESGIYPETRAIRELVREAKDPPFSVAIDLHCPYISGPYNQYIYQVGMRHAAVWARQQAFAALLERMHEGGLPYRASDDLPFGTSWNSAANYPVGCSCAKWMIDEGGVALAATFEIPYADAHGVRVTPESARQFGSSLVRAIGEWGDA